MGWVDEAAGMLDELVALRRRIHQLPEVGLHLPRTQTAVLEALDGLPLEITTGRDLSSVVAVLRGGAPSAGRRPAVLLRGDMDGLPITEASGEPFASSTGTMHACGHDLHVSGLVGAARLLSAHQAELPGDVVFMFQPGEEGPGGARPMIEEGVLEAAGRRVDAAFGIHVSGLYDKGTFLSKAGPAWAGSNVLQVTIHGRGGHASSPWMSVDPVPVVAELVTALQAYVTRRHNAFDPVVITVGQLHAGTATNIIAATAELGASVRTLSHESLAQLAAELPQLVEGIATAHGCTADVVFDQQYPVTINDTGMWDHAKTVLADLHGADRVVERPHPIMGAEDFSYVLDQVPGCFILLGARPDDVPAETAPSNHSPVVRFDDTVLGDQAAALAALAASTLLRLSPRVGD